MEIIKLNLNQYIPGRSVRDNVIACLPGDLEPIKVKGRSDEFLLDRKNFRIFVIETQSCPPKSKAERLPISTETDGRDRKWLYTKKVFPKGINIVDYDAYVIAAAEYKGDAPWYDKWELGGDYMDVIFSDGLKVGEDRSFYYSVLAMFDNEEYLKEYSEKNFANGKLGELELMEKYIYQRTNIDVDVHDENLLVYQDEGGFEGLLADVKWFHDGQSTGISNDKEFLQMWDGFDPAFLPPYNEEAISIIRTGVAMWDIDAKVEVDNKYNPTKCIDGTKEYIPFPSGKYLHIHFIATFGERFKGDLSFDLIHERSGYRSHWEIIPPDIRKYSANEPQFVATEGFPMELILGKSYQFPSDIKDFITIILFHNRKEIFRKEFQIRRVGA